MSKLQNHSLLAAQAAVADGAALECITSPFFSGSKAKVEINCHAFTGTVVVEVSETSDFASTTDYTLVAAGGTNPSKSFFIELGQFIRGTVTVRSAGSVDVDLYS